MAGEIAEIQSVIPYGLGIAGAALVLWWRIEARVTQEATDRKSDIAYATAQRKELEARLTSFELEVTRSFVPASYQEKMETRFLAGIEKLTGRLETVVARIENMGNQLARIDATVKRVEDKTSTNGES